MTYVSIVIIVIVAVRQFMSNCMYACTGTRTVQTHEQLQQLDVETSNDHASFERHLDRYCIKQTMLLVRTAPCLYYFSKQIRLVQHETNKFLLQSGYWGRHKGLGHGLTGAQACALGFINEIRQG